MIAWPFRSGPADETPHRIYGAVVAQARDRRFFTRLAIPDSVMGRYDLLALHVFLVCRRLKEGGKREAGLSQEVFDLMVADIDRALRELGVGDTSVPKRKRRMVHSFYGQIEDFAGPLDANSLEDLKPAVDMRFYDGHNERIAAALADYMLIAAGQLGDQSFDQISSAGPDWPAPIVGLSAAA